MLYFLNKLRDLSNGKPIGFKICIGKKQEFIDIVEAMLATNIIPDFITVDGAEGGTGAAPLEFIDYMGMALQDAVVLVNQVLKDYGLRKILKFLLLEKLFLLLIWRKQWRLEQMLVTVQEE